MNNPEYALLPDNEPCDYCLGTIIELKTKRCLKCGRLVEGYKTEVLD